MNTSYFKILIMAFLMIVMPMTLQARVVTINLSSFGTTDVTEGLRSSLSKLTYSDKAIINIDKAGTYVLRGTVTGNCSVVMKGLGARNTVIELDNGKNKGPFRAFTDDTFLEFTGTKDNPITVEMSDFSIRLKEHSGYWWVNDLNTQSNKQQEKYAVKIYHANKVDIQRVESYMKNAMITNFNLRVCHNVTVKNCILTNYNNCYTGGNLWFQGEAKNVLVEDNTFNKYGNDEALAFYAITTNAYDFKAKNPTDCEKSNIMVRNNVFNYGGYPDKDKMDIANDVLVNVTTSHNKEEEYGSHVSNITFKGNTFNISDVVKIGLGLSFSSSDLHRNVLVTENKFQNNAFKTGHKFYKADIVVKDYSKSYRTDSILIKGNTFINNADVINPSDGAGLSHIQLERGSVIFADNQVTNTVTTSKITGKKTGGQLLWAAASNGHIILKNNVCRGLSKIASVMTGDGIDYFSIEAYNNYFVGDTRIYCDKVKRLDLNFTGNTFKSNDMNFFLQEFAAEGSLIFNYNDVTASGGQLMTHWDGRFNTNSLRFNSLEVKGNVFNGMSNEKSVLTNFTNVKRRKVSQNRFR